MRRSSRPPARRPAVAPLSAIGLSAPVVLAVRATYRDTDATGALRPAPAPPLPASQCVDVLNVQRQRHFKPAFAAILSAEHLAIARRDVDLLSVAVMQTDRHQRAVRRHLVETMPSLADVLTAVERAVFR